AAADTGLPLGVRRDRGARAGRLPERALERFEHAHHAQAAVAVGARRPSGSDALDEVLALEPQRLDVGDPRAEDVSAASDVLAVAAGVLVEALVVDGQLA